jgi:uncharacterized protein (UPF0276 family)
MISLLQPPWISEHLSFNRFRFNGDEACAGFLLPPRQNEAGIEAAVASIRQFAHDTGRPVAVETGVNYLECRADEMADGEFVAEVVTRAECGILLDLHNLYTNAQNGRQSPAEFLSQLPLERVWEIHLAGGSERGGYWLDSHSGPTPRDVLVLARDLIPRLPNLKAVIFELFPAYLPTFGPEAVAKELEGIRLLWDSGRQARRQPAASMRPKPRPPLKHDSPSPRDWEDSLGAAVIGWPTSGETAESLAADGGVRVTHELLGEFRASMIVTSLRLTSRLLLLALGEAGFWQLLRKYWRTTPPHIFASSEAVLFAAFLRGQLLSVPCLADVLDFETTTLRVLLTKTGGVVRFAHDPSQVLLSLTRGKLPVDARPGAFEIEITPDEVTAEGSEEMHAQMVVH